MEFIAVDNHFFESPLHHSIFLCICAFLSNDVDFVVNQGSQRYYIQVVYDMTSEEKQIQEFNSLRNIPDPFKKIVIVNGTTKPWRNEEGFVIMGMKYFLLNSDSLEF